MTATAAYEADDSVEREISRIGAAARAAGRALGLADAATKNNALRFAAEAIRARRDDILDANAQDLAYAETRDLSAAFKDRLILTPDRIEGMAGRAGGCGDIPGTGWPGAG